jgi:hypothetical protein
MNMTRIDRLGAVLLLALGIALPGGAAEGEKGGGSICIAPFHQDPSHGPAMDLQGPGPGSKYSFHIDRKTVATVGEGERELVEDLPADRKVLVEVRLDGKPTESFRIDFRQNPEKRLCFWLYSGYWHWLVSDYPDKSRDCTCWEQPADR